jgi:hypothetical protein
MMKLLESIMNNNSICEHMNKCKVGTNTSSFSRVSYSIHFKLIDLNANLRNG